MPPLRLHLVGGGGTGKTFIARRLSAQWGVPALDLDRIFWDQDSETYEARRPEAERDRQLQAFIAQENWIVEGVYYCWAMDSLAAATHIVVLIPPLWLRQARIVRRFFRRRAGLEPGRKDTFAGLGRFLLWNHSYDRRYLPDLISRLERRKLTYAKCRHLAEVEAALRAAPAGRETAARRQPA